MPDESNIGEEDKWSFEKTKVEVARQQKREYQREWRKQKKERETTGGWFAEWPPTLEEWQKQLNKFATMIPNARIPPLAISTMLKAHVYLGESLGYSRKHEQVDEDAELPAVIVIKDIESEEERRKADEQQQEQLLAHLKKQAKKPQ